MNLNIFRKKPKVNFVNLEDFCNDYYEHYIFPVKKDDIDSIKNNFEGVKKAVVKIDQSFSKIPLENLIDEMTVIHLELFAVAWMHQFGPELAIRNSIFTTDYLNRKDLHEIWGKSERYNKLLTRICTNKDCRRCSSIAIARNRIELTLLYKGYDTSCILRTLNRYSSQIELEDGITINSLTFELCFRLKSKIAFKATFPLATAITGFYYDTKRKLTNIKVITEISDT